MPITEAVHLQQVWPRFDSKGYNASKHMMKGGDGVMEGRSTYSFTTGFKNNLNDRPYIELGDLEAA